VTTDGNEAPAIKQCNRVDASGAGFRYTNVWFPIFEIADNTHP